MYSRPLEKVGLRSESNNGEGKVVNQNFSFMEKFVPMLMSGRKILTNRSATEFRGKCEVGDTMYIFTGIRTANCRRIGTGTVIERVFWKFNENIMLKYYSESPIRGMYWKYFSWVDGFDYYDNFVVYFKKHKNRDLGFYCYEFEFNVSR